MNRSYNFLLTIAVVFFGLATCGPVFAQMMWETTPYKIQAYYAFSTPTDELSTKTAQEELLRDVEQLIDNRVGGFWQAQLVPAPDGLAKRMLTDIDALTTEDVFPEAQSKELQKFDKILLLSVRSVDSGWIIQVRDFDVRLRYFNGSIEVRCGQVSAMAQSLFDALREGFAPIGKIDTVEKDTVLLCMRGGLLDTPSPELFKIGKDKLFAPMIRFNANDGSLKKVNPVDWTYFWTLDPIVSDDPSAKSRVNCRIESGMRNALSARRRGRVEALAILVHPFKQSSVLKLVSQAPTPKRKNTSKDAKDKDATEKKVEEKAPDKLLRGYALYRVDPATNENVLAGYSDLNGEFVVKPDKVSPLHIFVIKNGEALLAKLPVLPGSAPVILAPVTDDDLRLEAEGYLLGIQEEIIDQIIMREIAFARMDGKIESGDKEAALTILKDLRNMKSADDFVRELQTKKGQFITDQPAQQARINQMFDKTIKLMSENMNIQRVRDYESKINNMK